MKPPTSENSEENDDQAKLNAFLMKSKEKLRKSAKSVGAVIKNWQAHAKRVPKQTVEQNFQVRKSMREQGENFQHEVPQFVAMMFSPTASMTTSPPPLLSPQEKKSVFTMNKKAKLEQKSSSGTDTVSNLERKKSNFKSSASKIMVGLKDLKKSPTITPARSTLQKVVEEVPSKSQYRIHNLNPASEANSSMPKILVEPGDDDWVNESPDDEVLTDNRTANLPDDPTQESGVQMFDHLGKYSIDHVEEGLKTLNDFNTKVSSFQNAKFWSSIEDDRKMWKKPQRRYTDEEIRRQEERKKRRADNKNHSTVPQYIKNNARKMVENFVSGNKQTAFQKQKKQVNTDCSHLHTHSEDMPPQKTDMEKKREARKKMNEDQQKHDLIQSSAAYRKQMAKLKLGFSQQVLNAMVQIEKSNLNGSQRGSKRARDGQYRSMDGEDRSTHQLVHDLEVLEKKSELGKVGKKYHRQETFDGQFDIVSGREEQKNVNDPAALIYRDRTEYQRLNAQKMIMREKIKQYAAYDRKKTIQKIEIEKERRATDDALGRQHKIKMVPRGHLNPTTLKSNLGRTPVGAVIKSSDHAYGLSNDLFTPQAEKNKDKKDFIEALKKIKNEVNLLNKQSEAIKEINNISAAEREWRKVPDIAKKRYAGNSQTMDSQLEQENSPMRTKESMRSVEFEHSLLPCGHKKYKEVKTDDPVKRRALLVKMKDEARQLENKIDIMKVKTGFLSQLTEEVQELPGPEDDLTKDESDGDKRESIIDKAAEIKRLQTSARTSSQVMEAMKAAQNTPMLDDTPVKKKGVDNPQVEYELKWYEKEIRRNFYPKKKDAPKPVSAQSLQHKRHQTIQDKMMARLVSASGKPSKFNRHGPKNEEKVKEPQILYGKAENNHHQPYPICMDYYSPTNAAVFGLITKQVQIHQLIKTGLQQRFVHLQSLKVEHMITSLSLDDYKMNPGQIMVCVSTQSQFKEKSEVVAYALDTKLDFEVVCSFRMIWNEPQITTLLYRQGCGLILAAFNGFIQVFDSVIINKSVWDNSKEHEKRPATLTKPLKYNHGAINVLAYSKKYDVIAFAGVQGKITVIDQTTKLTKGLIEAHHAEILGICFYDNQHQLISTSADGEVSIWDVQKFTHIQTVRHVQKFMTQKCLSAVCFFEQEGRTMLATNKVFNYKLQADTNSIIHKSQQFAIARDYQRELKNRLVLEGEICLDEDFQTGPSSPAVTKQEFMREAFNDEALQDYQPPQKEYNCSVLMSPLTKLIGVITDDQRSLIITIDSDRLMREWSIISGRSERSFLLQTREDQMAQANQKDPWEEFLKTGITVDRKKVVQVQRSPDNETFIAVIEGGEIQINNLKDGSLIYNNCNVPPIKMDLEIVQACYFNSQTKFWIGVGCWEGRVAFISKPTTDQGRNFCKFKKVRSSQLKDIVSMDINSENQLITASLDNTLAIWNSFVGEESKKIVLPRWMCCQEHGKNVAFVKFPFTHKKDFLLVVINDGTSFILDLLSEKFLEGWSEEIKNKYLEENKQYTDENFEEVDLISNKQIESISKHIMGKVMKNSIIDLKQKWLVSISEKTGCGKIHRLLSGSEELSNWKAIKDFETDNIKMIEIVDYFEDDEAFRALPDHDNHIFDLKICAKQNIFAVSRMMGQVSIFELETGFKQRVLNQIYNESIGEHMYTANMSDFKSPRFSNFQNSIITDDGKQDTETVLLGSPKRHMATTRAHITSPTSGQYIVHRDMNEDMSSIEQSNKIQKRLPKEPEEITNFGTVTTNAQTTQITDLARSLKIEVPKSDLLEDMGMSETLRTYMRVQQKEKQIQQREKKKFQDKAKKNLTVQEGQSLETVQAAKAIKDAQQVLSSALVTMQREQELKECLKEHQMYAHGQDRLQHKAQKSLVSKEALEAIQARQAKMREQGVPEEEIRKKKVTAINYIIRCMMPFKFHDKLYIIVVFDNKTARVFDLFTGIFVEQFDFMDNYNALELPLKRKVQEDDD